MNTLEMSTYSEPDFGLMNEFIEPNMSEEEKEAARKKTEEIMLISQMTTGKL